jgi:hypothetical protein
MRATLATPIILMSLVLAYASASTVTLTGSCPGSVLTNSSNYIEFTIANSGNGTASDMIIQPILSGMSTYNSAEELPIVTPGSNYTERFYMYNLSVPGSYAIEFLATYEQGASNFTTFFPCLAYVGRPAVSLASITLSVHGGSAIANISSLSKSPINASLVLLAPPELHVLAPQRNLTIAPYSSATERFTVSQPNLQATFPIIAQLSYSYAGIHYASIATAMIGLSSAELQSSHLSEINLGFGVAVAVIVVLIAVSFVKSRGRKAKAV